MNKKITMSELVDILALKHGGTKREVENFLKELMSLMTETISSGETLRINGLGVFKPVWVEERASVNVQTGEPTIIPGHYKLTFTPAKSVREAINEPFACFCVEELPDDAPLVSDVRDVDEMGQDAGDDDTEVCDADTISVEQAEGTPVEPEQVSAHEIVPIMPEPISEADPPLSIEKDTADSNPIVEDADDVVEVDEVEGIEDSDETPTPPAEVDEAAQDDAPAPLEVQQPPAVDTHESLSKAYRKGIWIGVAVSVAAFVLALVALYFCFPQWVMPLLGEDAPDDLPQIVTDTIVEPCDTTLLVAPDSIAVDTVAMYAEPQQLVAPVVVDTIRRGVFLTNSSYKYYGHKAFWVYIYEENSHIISNPDNVPVGTVITIPAAEKYGIDANDTTAINVALEKADTIKQRMKR